MSIRDDWKVLILRRFCGEYPPHDGNSSAIYKSSEDIAFDLSGMGEFTSDEISAFFAINGYEIEFNEEGRPVWKLMENNSTQALEE